MEERDQRSKMVEISVLHRVRFQTSGRENSQKQSQNQHRNTPENFQ